MRSIGLSKMLRFVCMQPLTRKELAGSAVRSQFLEEPQIFRCRANDTAATPSAPVIFFPQRRRPAAPSPTILLFAPCEPVHVSSRDARLDFCQVSEIGWGHDQKPDGIRSCHYVLPVFIPGRICAKAR